LNNEVDTFSRAIIMGKSTRNSTTWNEEREELQPWCCSKKPPRRDPAFFFGQKLLRTILPEMWKRTLSIAPERICPKGRRKGKIFEMKRIYAMTAVFLLAGLSTVQAGPPPNGVRLATDIVNLVGASAETLRILTSPSVVVVPAASVYSAAPMVVTSAPVMVTPV